MGVFVQEKLLSPADVWSISATELRTRDGRWIHPLDRDDLELSFDRMRADLDTLPCPFIGPLHTAKVVLCFAGPGSTEQADKRDAKKPLWVERRLRSFDGKSAIDFTEFHPAAKAWFVSRIASVLGVGKADVEALGRKVAILELCAYRGASTHWEECGFLPTTQLTRRWAHHRLFKDAREGKRVVIVLRARAWWGLAPGAWSHNSLFAPSVTAGGYLITNCQIGKAARKAARSALSLSL